MTNIAIATMRAMRYNAIKEGIDMPEIKLRRQKAMEENERDFVTFTDEEGNEFELDVIDYFDYQDEEYALLIDLSENADCDDGCEQEVYIMKVVVNGDTEEFVPADDDKMDALVEIAEARFAAGCDCDDDDCGCGCGHGHEHHGCGCGCDNE